MGSVIDKLSTGMAEQTSRRNFLSTITKVSLGAIALCGGAFAGLAQTGNVLADGCCGASTCSQCPGNTNVITMSTCCPDPCGSKRLDCYYCNYCTQINPPKNCTLLCQYSVVSGVTCPCVHGQE